MFRRPIKEIDAEYPAEEKYLDSIQRTVRESCSAAGMRSAEVSQMLLAVEEGATNIIRHAYLYEKGSIRLRIVIFKKQVVISLIDTGRSFHPEKAGQIDLSKLVESGRKGGLGFYMIQKIMDSVEYISSAKVNEIRMTRRFGSRSGAEGRPLLNRFLTLRVKFSIWTFFVVLVIVGGSFYYIDTRTARQLRNNLDTTVQALVTTIADQAAGYIINSRSDVEFDELIVSFERANPVLSQIVLVDSLGLALAHSGDIRHIRKPYFPPDNINPGRYNEPQPIFRTDDPHNYLILPIVSGEQLLGEAHVIYTTERINDQISRARQRTILLTLVLILFGVGAIYLLSNYFVRPIAKITNRIRRYASGDLESEMPLEGAEEFFEISRAFNEMMARLNRDQETIVARETMAKEIELASQIQKTLLPKELPEIPSMEIEAFYRAASLVGGDLYDVFRIGLSRYCLTVADVSGKGVPASLVMSMLRTVIQIYAARGASAKDTLIQVNEYLEEAIPPGIFITVLLIFYDAISNRIDLVSAGHNPIVFFRAGNKEIAKINPAGMPLGMPATLDKSFGELLEEVGIDLEPGDAFVAYTDGLTETTNRDGQQYGVDRLCRLMEEQLKRDKPASMADLTKQIVADVEEFGAYLRPKDDITFLVARCAPKGTLERKNAAKNESADDSTIDVRHVRDSSPSSSAD